jgi:hypothetical protein
MMSITLPHAAIHHEWEFIIQYLPAKSYRYRCQKAWASGQDVLAAVPEQPRPYEEERRADDYLAYEDRGRRGFPQTPPEPNGRGS